MIEPWAVAVDTNVLIYAEGAADDARKSTAVTLLRHLNRAGYVLPVQVAGECLRVMQRKMRLDAAEAIRRLDELSINARRDGTTPDAFESACVLMSAHGFDVWDAIIVAVSASSDCSLLLSEDMQDGFVWRGLTIANPFMEPLHPLLHSALNDPE
jgi:predicted nucleic acid-binding protein